jgi:hypothetical protein
MGVTICLPLFGNPGRELEEGALVKGKRLRDFAAELNERLHKAADTLDRLTEAGWTSQVAMFDVLLHQKGIETREEAIRRLQALGINPEELLIIEDVEDEDNQST